ncbi:RxLR effector protein [Phytophthora megakarya]|uniref:RxLR effector protein n=1 Tax=Phytophthora megakarya TaxID=4795 RepID=A0A225UZ39_9STRA|nr:RxLR effector protein [Phytophthora megakarya]
MCSIYIVVLTTILFLVSCSVTAAIPDIPRLARLPNMADTAATTRFLRGYDTDGNVDNEGVNIEERGPTLDKIFNIPILKAALRISLRKSETPEKVLKQFLDRRYTLKENYMLVWTEYVLQFRKKLGPQWAPDAYVIKILKETIPDINLPKLFQAMEKNPNLQSFAKDLQKEADKLV